MQIREEREESLPVWMLLISNKVMDRDWKFGNSRVLMQTISEHKSSKDT